MLDDDPVAVDLNLSHNQPQHLLSLLDGESPSTFLQASEEDLEAFGELQVCLLLGELGFEGLQLGGGGILPAPEFGDPCPQLIERDQLFLVSLDEAGHSHLVPGHLSSESLFLLAGRAGLTPFL